jgi:hypothetical protein
MRERPKEEYLWRRITEGVNYFLSPIVFASLGVLVIAQFVTHISPVRKYMDAMENRFTSESVVAGTSGNHEKAWIDLYFSSPSIISQQTVRILLNGQVVGNFQTAHQKIMVANGDIVGFQSQNGGPVYISIDQNNADLLEPAPGYEVELTTQNPDVQLPAATFLK